MWFDSWGDLVRILVVGSAAYLAVIAVLRISGKRTLAKLNAFDLVVTVAVGSTLATILLNADVSWSEGAVALSLLAVLQFCAAWVSSRLQRARRALTTSPSLLLHDGIPVGEALMAQRVSREELAQAVRASGVGDLSLVAAVVLETDGSMSVIPRSAMGNGSALQGLSRGNDARRHPEPRARNR